MKKLNIYLCALAVMGILSCSSEEVKDEPGTDPEVDNLVSQDFISTLESWINIPQTSVEWIHETNSDGELVTSTMYEKYPRRVLWELEYLEYNENQLPIVYEKRYFEYGEQVDLVTFEVTYHEDQTIENITAYRDGSLLHEYSFSQLDDKRRVKSILNFDSTGEFLNRVVYEYGSDGNHKTVSVYSTDSGNDDSDIIEKWDYTFTHFGNRESTNYLDGETGSTTEWTYSYREDYTLESTDIVAVSEGYPDAIYRREYDKEEKIVYQSVTYGDERWEDYYSNGNLQVIEYYVQDVLMWVQTIAEDGSSEWKIINPDDGSYRIEYYDADDELYKVEYYDADDNLFTTENQTTSQTSQKLQRRTENKHFSSPLPRWEKLGNREEFRGYF